MLKIQPKQIEEWFESPVTQYFHELLQKRLDHTFSLRAEVYFPFEPHKTQESKANLLGMEHELGTLVDAFIEQDLESLEVEEKASEQVGNPSERGSSPH